MKSKSAEHASSSQRCIHRDTNGRQCRTLSLDPRSRLCPHHFALRQKTEEADVYEPLIRSSQGLQTAQGINYSLSNLYELLAKNRISPRRASVLAYINSLLLRTLPAIDADNAAGITDPTTPIAQPPSQPPLKPVLVSASGQTADTHEAHNHDADTDPPKKPS